METVHQILIESVSGGFWKFCGYWILLTVILSIPARLILALVQILVIKKEL